MFINSFGLSNTFDEAKLSSSCFSKSIRLCIIAGRLSFTLLKYESNSVILGVASSAAADGVGALKSATKSQIVKSVS